MSMRYWGGGAFSPGIFKETVKREHWSFHPCLLAWRKPSHTEVILHCVLAGSRPVQSLSLVSGAKGEARTSLCRERLQAPSAAHKLCMQHSVPAVLQTQQPFRQDFCYVQKLALTRPLWDLSNLIFLRSSQRGSAGSATCSAKQGTSHSSTFNFPHSRTAAFVFVRPERHWRYIKAF